MCDENGELQHGMACAAWNYQSDTHSFCVLFSMLFDTFSLLTWINLSGWPAYHQSTVHASPLLYDIDKDGVREIALATYNGEVLFFR